MKTLVIKNAHALTRVQVQDNDLEEFTFNPKTENGTGWGLQLINFITFNNPNLRCIQTLDSLSYFALAPFIEGLADSNIAVLLDCEYNLPPLSISPVAFSNQINVYPNPTSGLTNLEFPTTTRFINAYSMEGAQILSRQVLSEESLQMELPVAGIYFVEFIDLNGLKNTRKLVVGN